MSRVVGSCSLAAKAARQSGAEFEFEVHKSWYWQGIDHVVYLTLTVPLALVLVTKTLSHRPPEKMMSTMIWMKSFLSTSNNLQSFFLTVFSAWRKPCSPRRRKRRSVSRWIGLHKSRTGASCSPWTPSHRTRLWKRGVCVFLALRTCRRWSTE